jgi:lipopolysaccharide/colanic/teichoic acid biosynthesis glycosyltransferase
VSDVVEATLELGAIDYPVEDWAGRKGQPAVSAAAEMSDSVYVRESGRLGYRVVKRLFDIVFSSLAIILLVIPIVILSVLVAVESHGSPFYAQLRVGKGGVPFRILKLRSMVADAYDVEKYLTPQQIRIWESEGKVDDDPRIIQIGRFIRKTSIDEIPQFLNVLTGTMSVIGPRPITDKEVEQFGQLKARFLSVKPGITGWWQVGERNDVRFEDGSRQRVELYYVEHRGLRLDALIFFKTFRVMFRKTGK